MCQVYSYGLFFYFENTNILWYNTAYLSVSNKGDARVEKLKKYLEPVLIVTLSALVFFTIYTLSLLQGTARVVNYAGIVRGATQRGVKLEIAAMPNDSLIKELDGILDELQHGGSQYHLIKLEDKQYQEDLQTLSVYWLTLKEEIQISRQTGYRNTNLLDMSETYFHLADRVVSDAEIYSQHLANRLEWLEIGMVINISALLMVLLVYHFQSIRLRKKYTTLSTTAYVDIQTGLDNKSSCEKKLRNAQFLDKQVGILMFDMNNLKQINDSLGHASGDSVIQNFARMLRLSVPEHQFVGRFGGDEFLVILHHADASLLDTIIASLHEKVNQFNQKSSDTKISYAVGKAHTSWYAEKVTMKVLFEKADHNMYQHKMAMKESRAMQLADENNNS